MKEDIPWAYVAMIFIAFASWVYGRLKEAAEIRRTRAVARRAAQKARNHAQPVAAPSPYRSPEAIRPASAPVPAPLSVSVSVPTLPAEEEPPRTFRELFERLQEHATPVDQEIPRQPPPPPLPDPVKTAEMAQSEADRLFYGPARIAQPAPPLQVERLRGKTSSNLNRILKNRSTLREAMILKEMLDTPISMRE